MGFQPDTKIKKGDIIYLHGHRFVAKNTFKKGDKKLILKIKDEPNIYNAIGEPK